MDVRNRSVPGTVFKSKAARSSQNVSSAGQGFTGISTESKPFRPSLNPSDTVRFGAIDPISLGAILVAGTAASGISIAKIRASLKQRKITNGHIKQINAFLEEMGSKHKADSKNVYSLMTAEMLLTSASGLTKTNELLPLLTLVETNMPEDSKSLLRQLYLEKGVSHPSKGLRLHFIQSMVGNKAPRNVFDPFLKQLEHEQDADVAAALGTPLIALAAPEDLDEFKAGLAVATSPNGFRKICIQVLSQPQYFNNKVLGIFVSALKTEKNPELITLLREKIASYSDGNAAELFTGHLDSDNAELKKSALQYLGSIKNPEYAPLVLDKFLVDLGKPPMNKGLAEAYQSTLNGLLTEQHHSLLLNHLVKNQKNETSDIQEALLALMGNLGSGLSVEPLFQYIESPDNKCKEQAIDALSKCVKNSDHPMLLKKLISTDTLVRQAAAKGLTRISDYDDIQTLIQAYEKETVPAISKTLIEALQKRNTNPEAFETLTQALTDNPSQAVKSLATQSLKSLGMKAVPAMVKTLDQLLEAPKADLPKHLTKDLENAITDALKATFNDPYAKDPYYFTQHRKGRETVKPVVPHLVSAINCRSANVQRAALSALQLAPQAAAVPALINYQSSAHAQEKTQAWDIYFKCLDSAEKAYLIPVLLEKSNEPLNRQSHEMVAHGLVKLADVSNLRDLCAVFSKITDPQCRTILEKGIRDQSQSDSYNTHLSEILLKSSDVALKKLMIELIGLKQGNTLKPLLSAIDIEENRKNPELYSGLEATLLKRLNEISEQELRRGIDANNIPYFVRSLSLPNDAIQRSAILHLQKARSSASIPGVLNYLDGNDCKFPVEATHTLTETGVDTTHRDIIISKLSSAKETVRLASAKLFSKIFTAQDFPLCLERLSKETNFETRKVYMDLLNQLKNDAISVDYLNRALEAHDDLEIRELTLNKLRNFGFAALAPMASEFKKINEKITALTAKIQASPESDPASQAQRDLKVTLSTYRDKLENNLYDHLKMISNNQFPYAPVKDIELPVLLEILNLPTEKTQELVLSILKNQCGSLTTQPVSQLFQFVESNPPSRLMPMATDTILSKVSEAHQSLLREKLNSKQKSTQMIAAQALQKIGKEVELSTFFNILEKEDQIEPNRDLLEAIKALGRSTEAFEFLNDVLAKKSNPVVLSAAVQGLRMHHGIKAIPSLIKLWTTRPEVVTKSLTKQLSEAIAEQVKNTHGTTDGELMFQALALPSEPVQEAAFQTVKSKLTDKNQIIAPLLNYIESPDCKFRDAAILYLEGSIVQAQNRDLLVEKLNSPHKSLRLAALRRLKAIPKISDVPILFEQIGKEKEQEVGLAIQDTLTAHLANEQFIPLAGKALNEQDNPAIRLAAVNLLKSAGYRSLPILLNALNAMPEADEKNQTLYTAIEQAIPAILDATKAPQLLPPVPPSQEGLIFTLLKTDSEVVQARALKALGNVSASTDFVAPLFRYLESEECKLPQAASDMLVKCLNANNHLLLMDKLSAKQAPVRLAAAIGLANQVQNGDLPTFLRALSNETDAAVCEKLNILVQNAAKDRGTFQFLALELLENANNNVKNAVVLALQDHGINALKPLFKALEETSDKTPLALTRDLERAIVKVIKDAKDDGTATTLLEKIESSHKATQRVAVLALFPFVEKWEKEGSYDQAVPMACLRKLKENKNPIIQEPAARALDVLIKKKINALNALPGNSTNYSEGFTQGVKQLSESAPEKEIQDAAKNAHARLLLAKR